MINQKVLIMGTDAETSRTLSRCLKKHFFKVYVQNDAALFEHELLEVKPEIIFLDLNLGQSEESHNVLTSHHLRGKDVLIFGYSTNPMPELIAHGVESGIEKSFLLPFDEEKILRSITDNLKVKRTKRRTLLAQPLKVEISFKSNIISVDENGIKIRSPHYISKGTVFRFNDPLCREIFEQDSIFVIVTKTSQTISSLDYEIFIEPKDPTEATSLALRRFIMSQ